MEKLNLLKLKANAAKSYTFFMIPCELINNPAFDAIDYGSKLLYGLMLSRAGLSATNPDFIDDNGDVYIIYTVEQVMESMRCSRPTAIKMLKQLDDIGLIEKNRQGQGKPSILYVMDFSTANLKLSTENKSVDFLKLKKLTSRSLKNELQEVKNFDSNHINQNSHIKRSDINPSIQQKSTDKTFDNLSNVSLDSYDFTDKVSNPTINLNPFANLNPKYSVRQAELSEISNLISEVNSSRRTHIRVGKKDIPTYQVKSAFSRLTARHIENVLDSLEKKSLSSDSKVKNQKNYILTALFNVSNATLPVDVDFVKSTVRNNIRFDYLLNRYPDKTEQEHLNELFNIIVEVLISTKKSFRLAKSEFYADDVKRVFASLTYEHVESVLNAIQINTSEVKSVKAYIQTALWNSFSLLKIQTTFDAHHFLFENFGILPKR